MEPLKFAWVDLRARIVAKSGQAHNSRTVDRARSAAQVAGLAPEKVQIHTTLLGGGFGLAREIPLSDFVSRSGAGSEGHEGAGGK